MKRWLCFLLVALQILMLCACGQNEESTTTEATENGANTTSVPVETDSNVVEMAVAVKSGTASEYSISDGDVYLIDVSNYDDPSQNKWSASITVGDSFDMNSVKYIGCCNEYLEAVDVEIRCELLNSILTIKSTGDTPNSDVANNSLYLVIVCEGITGGEAVRFVPNIDDNTTGTAIRPIQRMTGEVIYSDKLSQFSDGFSWCTLTYVDTQKNTIAIVDKDGTICAEIKNSDYVSFGDFYNGVALVKNGSEALMFINTNGEVVFSSDNPDYEGQIKGMYPGGYIFLERTEANLTSNTSYYAIMDCNENFIINWTAYDGFWLFNYMGGDIFAFLDGFERGDDDTVKFYNAETKVWTTVKNIDGGSLWRLPDLVAENSDGWIIIGEGLERVSGGGILVSTKDGKSYTLDSDYDYGIPSEGRIVVIDTGYYDDDLNGFGYVNTQDVTHDMVDYEYLNLVQNAGRTMETIIAESYMEFGYWPSYNFNSPVPEAAHQKTNTYLYDYQLSNGVMLLQLKGADGADYYALMNEQGENVIEPVKGIAVDTLGHGRFLVSRDDVYYILDESGHEVEILSGQDYGTLLSAEAYSDGLAWVETSRYVNAFIDVDGNYILGKDDVLREITTIEVSPLTVSVELVEKDETEGVSEPAGDGETPKETPASAFEYEYGYGEVKSPEGGYDSLAAVIITKYVGNDTVVVIPAEIDGLPVMTIAESAFDGSNIKELYFAGSLTEIEAHAFANCTELSTVVLPDNWMRLGVECFTGCTSLNQLEVPAECSFSAYEVWNDELGVYEYVVGSPVSENDTTVVVTRAG